MLDWLGERVAEDVIEFVRDIVGLPVTLAVLVGDSLGVCERELD